MTAEQKAEEYKKKNSYYQSIKRADGTYGAEQVLKVSISQAFIDGYHEGFKDCAKARLNITTISDCPIKDEWHLTKNELPQLQTATDTGDEYNTLVLCFWYDTDSRGNKTKVYDLDRWFPENDIWESGKQRDEVEAWMYLPEPPEEI